MHALRQSAVLRKAGSVLSVADLRRLRCRPAENVERVIVLKLTLDSSESLEDAMRVLGALYGVTLIVSPDEHDATTSARKTAPKARRKSASKAAGSKKTVNRAPSAKKVQPDVPSTEAVAARSEQKTARRSGAALSHADVRSWARENGFTVSDRGRLPASVVTAYRNAQSA